MSTIHDQAMNYVYQQVLQRLLSFFSRAERTALQLLIQRLVVAAGGSERIGEFKVLAVQTGTRDSCYALAMLRAAQLSIAGRAPATFQLRVATLRYEGNDLAALENMHRSHAALFLCDDPRVELLMVDHREVMPFDHQAPISEGGSEANRINLLMVGHRRTWNEALELWDDRYLATAEFHGQVARWNNGVDVLAGCDSAARQRRFIDGLDRAVRKVGIGPLADNSGSYDQLFALLDGLDGDCYRRLYTEPERMPWRPEGQFEACRRTVFIDVHDMLVAKLDDRWPLLSEFLGFKADEWSAALFDDECPDPLVAAYLCGLQARFVEGHSYEAGVQAFVQRSLAAMRRRQVPEPVCEHLAATFAKPQGYEELRQKALAGLQARFGLNENQIVCLLFAPFTDSGAGLERFLRACHPGMLVAIPDLHRAMQGLHAPEQVLQWMTEVSGLPVRLIGRLYAMEPVPALPQRPLETASPTSDDAFGGDRSQER
ncbi:MULTISPECIES: hypothetical protein [unclassified Pseudomonas]|uniref:hypothetical protein n=1 Tax=unclassified Pseudomonas TaxID=196821 RepID=UPI000A1FF1FD|nr:MULTISPECIES: hypothetical protein [unclassified Pseudomonas]